MACRGRLAHAPSACRLPHPRADAALQHIAAVAGTRYDPNSGVLTLVSTKYPHREENRRHIVRTIKALVEEGRRVHPSEAAAVRVEAGAVQG